MHFRNLLSGRIGFAPFSLYFIPRDKLHPSGSKKFIPWAFGPRDKSFLPSGCNSSLGMKYSLQGAKPNSFIPLVTKFPTVCFVSIVYLVNHIEIMFAKS